MKDRIEIDGVWYVKEDTTKKKDIELDITESTHRVYESDNFCFEASLIINSSTGLPYKDCCSIDFTDKSLVKDSKYKVDYWDNPNWFRGVLEDNPESIREAKEVLDDEGLEVFKLFLADLKKRDWI